MKTRNDWSVNDLGQHTKECVIWDHDYYECSCGGDNQKWRGKNNGVPHPDWVDAEVVRRLVYNEPVGRPVSDAEARVSLIALLDQGLSVLEMSERMGRDRRWVSDLVEEVKQCQQSD